MTDIEMSESDSYTSASVTNDCYVEYQLMHLSYRCMTFDGAVLTTHRIRALYVHCLLGVHCTRRMIFMCVSWFHSLFIMYLIINSMLLYH